VSEQHDVDPVRHLVEEFVSRAREEFENRLAQWPTDLSREEVHEVLGALLARQVTLACEMAMCPSIWNGHTAPLLLRAMADVYISLAWVIQDPVTRSRQFIHYGLGQEKLQLEHRKAELKARPAESAEEEEFVEVIEAWINRQRWSFLTDVNLGSWSGISTRKMAEEAGCLDFYNYVYTPFSACTHSMWNHIGIYNLKECRNPLHKFHQQGAMVDAPIDPHYLYLAAKYLQKAFATFDAAMGTKVTWDAAFAVLCREFEDFPRDPTVEGEN
jgi:hypothetical protein